MNKEILGIYPNSGVVKVVGTKTVIAWAPVEITDPVIATGNLKGGQNGMFNSPVHTGTTVADYVPAISALAHTVTSGGSVNTGVHLYAYSFVFNGYETKICTPTLSVTTTAGNNTVNLSSIPTVSVPTELANSVSVTRNIYRTAAGGSTFYYVATIADNTTTTYVDSVADSTITSNVNDLTQSYVKLITFSLLSNITTNDFPIVAINVNDITTDYNLNVKNVINQAPNPIGEEQQNDVVSYSAHASGTEYSDIIDLSGFYDFTILFGGTAGTGNTVTVTFETPGYITSPGGTALVDTDSVGWHDITGVFDTPTSYAIAAGESKQWMIKKPYGLTLQRLRIKSVYTNGGTATNTLYASIIKR